LKEALERVVELAREGNRYLNEQEPWKSYKTSPSKSGQTIGISIQIVANAAVLLQPFLPETSSKILKGVSGKTSLGWEYSGKCFVKPGAKIASFEPFFHKVSAVDLRDRLAQLRSSDTVEAQV